MDYFKEFLESSTIHGLSNISTSKNYITKVSWILITIGGFITAGFIIEKSVDDWRKHPVATTEETLPISKADLIILD